MNAVAKESEVGEAVTVVLAVFNQSGYTKVCLDAVFRHSPPETAVVVWDNGSTESVRQLCSCYPKDRLVYSRSDANVGVPEAYNRCLRTLVRTDKVCFLHNDVVVTPEWLARLAAHMDGQRSGSVICPRTNYCDKNSFVCDAAAQERACRFKPPNKGARITEEVVKVVLKSTFGDEGLDGFSRRVSAQASGTARSAAELGDFCFLTRAETILAVGGFDERFRLHTGWDLELRDRLERSGYGIRMADDVFVHHHGNLTSDGPGFDYRRILEHNRSVYGKLRHEGRRAAEAEEPYRIVADDGDGEPAEVLVFTPYYVPHALGGAEVSLHMALRNCAEFGVPVEAHCFLDEAGEQFRCRSRAVVDGVRVIRHQDCDEVRFAAAARKILSEKEPRAALFQGDRAKQAAYDCASLGLRTRMSWFFRNMDEITRPNMYGVRMHEVLPKMLGPVFANSQFLADRVREEHGRECVVVLPSVSEGDVRVKSDRRCLACMAATEEKGVRVVMRLADRMPHQRFLVAGPASASIVADLAAMPNVEYLGALKDPRAVYSRTRVLLVPSLVHDSSPRVVLEAQASGIPVIGADRGGIRHMIGKGGICLPEPCSESDFVGAVASMDSARAYQDYSRLARQNFEEFRRHRGPYAFRSAITSAARDGEAKAHEGTVAELVQSLSGAPDPFRLVRAAVAEKLGLNRTDAVDYILGRLRASQSGATQLDAAAANFGGMIESVRSIKVGRKPGCQKILITMKPRSGGGGVLTVLNLARGLREAGHDAHFLEVGNERTLICRIDGGEVPKGERCSLHSLLQCDKTSSPIMGTLLNPDIVVFGDVEHILEPKTLGLARKRFFLLCCGLPGVHSPYYLSDWLTNPKKIRSFEKVFVRNLSFHRYLAAMAALNGAYEGRVVSWQGGCDYDRIRREHGHCDPPDGESVLRLGTFSKWEWWKGPQINLLAAAAVSRMLRGREVRWYVPMAWDDHRRAARNAGLKLEYSAQRSDSAIVTQHEVLSRMRRSHVGLEMAFSDAFPRSVNEAMNLGLPVVVSSAIEHVRGNPVYEELCVVQNPNDILGAAEKAARLLADGDAWAAASRAAMEIGSGYHASREADIFIKEAGLPRLA